jgi:hypothetical protein
MDPKAEVSPCVFEFQTLTSRLLHGHLYHCHHEYSHEPNPVLREIPQVVASSMEEKEVRMIPETFAIK